MWSASLIFAAAVVAVTVLAVLAAAGKGGASRIIRSSIDHLPWLLLLAAATLAEWVFNRLPSGTPPLMLDQGTPAAETFIQSLQAVLPTAAVPFFSFIYLALFPALVIAVPLALLSKEAGDRLRVYCAALAISYVALMTLHALVGSPRPALTPGSGVSGLLYDDPRWGSLSLDISSRGNSLPSGHTTIVTAMLVSLRELPWARCLLTAVLALTAFGVLYLGIHWPLDVLLGLAVGAASASVARASIYKREAKPECH